MRNEDGPWIAPGSTGSTARAITSRPGFIASAFPASGCCASASGRTRRDSSKARAIDRDAARSKGGKLAVCASRAVMAHFDSPKNHQGQKWRDRPVDVESRTHHRMSDLSVEPVTRCQAGILAGFRLREIGCVNIYMGGIRFPRMRVPDGRDFEATVRFPICVTHSKHFRSLRFVRCERCCAPGRAVWTSLAGRRLRALHCADERRESTRTGRRYEFVIDWMSLPDGTCNRPNVCLYAPGLRCNARSSCETFRHMQRVCRMHRANRARLVGSWFEYCCSDGGVTNERDARYSEEPLMT